MMRCDAAAALMGVVSVCQGQGDQGPLIGWIFQSIFAIFSYGYHSHMSCTNIRFPNTLCSRTS